MEAAFQSAFASSLLQNLITLIGLIYKKFQKDEEAVKNLETTTIRAWHLFDSINTFHLDKPLQSILQDRLDTMAILCLDVEDLIEDILVGAPHNSVFWHPIRNSTWPYDIEKLQRRLSNIFEEVNSIVELTRQTEAETPSHNGGRYMMQSRPLIGREEDIKDIIQKLISDDSDHNNGVSILGMDGLGKTMLAEAIFADERILESFCCRLRASSTEGCFSFKEETDQHGSSVGNNGVFNQQNQRLLILFDNLLDINFKWEDLKTENQTQWSPYREIKILITTFNPQVSRIASTTAYYLKRLSDEKCKQVIVKNALFLKENLPELHLSHIASTLATKCEGFPVLARILGIVLARSDMNDWANVLKKELRDISDVRWEIFSTLRLSYLKQPQLKKCLAYFSLFPHKYSFYMDDLIHLLVGEGIIQLDEGDEYFSDLQGMSILQQLDNVNHTEKPEYELHKFSHIFSQLDASKICLRLEEGMPLNSGGVRHLSLLCDIQHEAWTDL